MSVRKENRWRKRLHEDARELYDRKLELESAFMQRNDSIHAQKKGLNLALRDCKFVDG